jgi:plastocyanin
VTRRPLIAVVLAGAALAAAPAEAGTTRTVKVEDNFFAPKKITVNLNTTVRWTWPEDGGDVHDVKLESGPKGVKKFESDPGSGGYSYRRKLSRAGTYKLLCTFHEDDDMRMTIVVRRRR